MPVKVPGQVLNTESIEGGRPKVFIANTYSWFNKGDAAIVLGTVDVIRALRYDAEIVISSATPKDDAEAYARYSIGVVSGPLRKPSNRSWIWRRAFFICSIVSLLICGLMFRIKPSMGRNKRSSAEMLYMRSISSADVVISCGGGFWSGNAGLSILGHIAEIWIAVLMQKPVVAVGVSVGRFRQPVLRYLVGATLRRMDRIVLREGASVAHVRALGLDDEDYVVGGDMAFCLDIPNVDLDKMDEKSIEDPELRVGVTARWWSFPTSENSSSMRERYEIELAAALDQIVESYRAEIVFLPQVIVPFTDDDRIVQKKIRDRMKYQDHCVLLDQDYSPGDLIDVISSMDFMIATRFHSAIFSLLAGTPVLAIAYEIKTEGILTQLGLERWFLEITDFDRSSLFARFSEMVEQRAQILEHVIQRVPRETLEASTKAVEALSPHLPA